MNDKKWFHGMRARIALGYTQKKLAERVGLKEQQIQRYEETEYPRGKFFTIERNNRGAWPRCKRKESPAIQSFLSCLIRDTNR